MVYTISTLPKTRGNQLLLPLIDKSAIIEMLEETYPGFYGGPLYEWDEAWDLLLGLIKLQNEQDGIETNNAVNFDGLGDYLKSLKVVFTRTFIKKCKPEYFDDNNKELFFSLQDFLPENNAIKHCYLLSVITNSWLFENMIADTLSNLTAKQRKIYSDILLELNIDDRNEYTAIMNSNNHIEFEPNITSSWEQIAEVSSNHWLLKNSLYEIYTWVFDNLDVLATKPFGEWLKSQAKNESKVLAYHINEGEPHKSIFIIKE